MPNKKITGAILSLAWPAIVTNVTTPLLSLVDVAIVGHIGSAVYLGAVAIGGSVFNLLYWLFGFLRMGTSGITSQAYGAADSPETVRILVRSLSVALMGAVLLIVLSGPVASVVIRFMDADGATEAPARLYFSIAVWGAPGVLATYALSGWFIGLQDSKPVMWMALVANTLNILISLVLVFGFGLDIRGVAAGTASAQWISALVGIFIMMRKLRLLDRRGWRSGLLAWSRIRQLFKVNSDIFLRTLCLVSVTLYFTHAGAVGGVDILAANALLMQLFLLFSYFMDGFAFAGEALAGRSYGAGDRQALSLVVRRLIAWGLWIASAATLVYLVFGKWIMSLLTDDPSVLQVASHYHLWAVAIPFAGFLSFIWDGIYIGLTWTRLMLLTMVIATAMFFAAYHIFGPSLHNHGLWLAFVLYLAARSIVQSFLYLTRSKRMWS